ncbi:MAG: NUDIX hydrolase [Hydrococcus sp. Prado102]|jgi:8-oxo-dGTP pyrophosphatase MutT (NUDIX family)|nr:NUDIX hydrolase [Hydrococcus sp. Prado102]
MKEIKKWKTLNSQWVINNQWCRIRQDEIELPNGKIIDDYFVNVRPEIALVLPVTENQEIVFVRQYRHGIEDILLELPAGAFDGQTEDSITAACREMEEETGYVSDRIIKLATVYDNPVKDSNRIHIFIALDASPTGQQNLDVTEDIEVILIPIKKVKQLISNGQICVAGTITAILLGLDFMKNANED